MLPRTACSAWSLPPTRSACGSDSPDQLSVSDGGSGGGNGLGPGERRPVGSARSLVPPELGDPAAPPERLARPPARLLVLDEVPPRLVAHLADGGRRYRQGRWQL